jgi:hypothetical protein
MLSTAGGTSSSTVGRYSSLLCSTTLGGLLATYLEVVDMCKLYFV